MKIKKAVFPVAGFGTRFLPATKSTPKEMLPVVDKPLIQYAVEEASRIGVEEFIFITHRAKGTIDKHFQNNSELYNMLLDQGKDDLANSIKNIGGPNAKFISVDQGEPKGLGHAIGCAEKYIAEDDFFVVILADDLIYCKERNVLEQLKEQAEKYGKQVLALEQIPAVDISKFGVVDPESSEGRTFHLKGIVEKPLAEDAPSNLAVVGRYLFNKSIFDHIDNDNAGKHGEIQITDAILSNINDFVGFEFEGDRFDCGSKVGYLKANIALGLANEELSEGLKIYNLARKLLFLLPPEQSQNISHFFLKLFSGLYKSKQTRFSVKGLKIKNRLGLAAGLDKNARLINEFDNIGFGFVEVGTITPKPQYGNPKPRIKRLISNESLLNSLGFPNEGVATIKPRLQKVRDDICLGVNIGPNKDTVPQEIVNDYLFCYREVFKYADFVTMNISSPNTPNLRSLHNIENFKSVIDAILNERSKHQKQPKIFIKISPDEESKTYKDLIETINDSAIDGVVISNTSDNQNLKESLKVGHLPGGISGKSLKNSANKILKEIKTIINQEKIIVAVGGIFDVDSYNEKFELGADLVQMYTGLIYEGPNLVKRIVKNDNQISSNS